MKECIGGSRGGVRDARPPPGRPNSFDFMQFSGKFGVFTPPLEGSRPPLGKILDPPLEWALKLNHPENKIDLFIDIFSKVTRLELAKSKEYTNNVQELFYKNKEPNMISNKLH